MRRIYLDHSATTPPDPVVMGSMERVQKEFWGNPSSLHSIGQEAKRYLDDARGIVSFYIGCEASEVIFTGGGSEADNLAIKGVVDSFYAKSKRMPKFGITAFGGIPSGCGTNSKSTISNTENGNNGTMEQWNSDRVMPHIVTSAFEHHAVLNTIKELETAGIIEATYIKPNAEGLIEVREVEKAIKSNTILVSIMYVNNEVGTVQPIRRIAELLNQKSKIKNQKFGKILFHTDAVQAAEYFQLNPKYLGVDLMTLSAHKFHGPKGVGVLYLKKGTPIVQQIIGGAQENRKRAGTEDLAGIAGLATACEIIMRRRADEGIDDPKDRRPESLIGDQTTHKIKKLRDKLEDEILRRIPETKINGSRELRSPAISNISFNNAEGESILLMLDKEGVAASSGSACTSSSLEPSHVLLAMGIPPEEAHGSIRFSLGKETTEEDIDKVLELLPPIIERLRKMSPMGK